jgi:hypothetical protein
MISLILLPVLCIWVLKKQDYVERCMPINMPSIYHPNLPKNAKVFDIQSILEVKRNYIHFELNGNRVDDKGTLSSFRNKLLKIVEVEDTITGLHIDIRENVKYGSIIELLDICKQDTFAAAYLLQDNELWYFHGKKVSDREKEERRERYNAYKNDQSKENFTDKNYAFFHNEGIIRMRYFFILFLLFSIISFFYTKNNFWKK